MRTKLTIGIALAVTTVLASGELFAQGGQVPPDLFQGLNAITRFNNLVAFQLQGRSVVRCSICSVWRDRVVSGTAT